jgi:hypothetical protein
MENLFALVGHDNADHVVKIVLPHGLRASALEQLYSMNISRRKSLPGPGRLRTVAPSVSSVFQASSLVAIIVSDSHSEAIGKSIEASPSQRCMDTRFKDRVNDHQLSSEPAHDIG